MVLTPDSQDSYAMIQGMSAGLEYLFGQPDTVFTTVKVRDLLFDGIKIECAGSSSNLAWAALCTGIKVMYNRNELPPAIRYDNATGNFLYSFFFHVSIFSLLIKLIYDLSKLQKSRASHVFYIILAVSRPMHSLNNFSKNSKHQESAAYCDCQKSTHIEINLSDNIFNSSLLLIMPLKN